MSTEQSRVLVLVSEMKKALAKATTLEDLTRVRNEAEAVRCLVQKAKLGLTMHNEAAEFKLRAERKAGEMLAALSLNGGNRKSVCHDVKVKLEDLGISYHQSSRWQREAAVSETEFEAFLREVRDAEKDVTSAELLRRASRQGVRNARRRRTIQSRPAKDTYGPNARPTSEVDVSRAEREIPAKSPNELLRDLVAETQNHRALLAEILLPFCEGGQPVKSAARRHAANLLHQLGSLIDQLALLVRRPRG